MRGWLELVERETFCGCVCDVLAGRKLIFVWIGGQFAISHAAFLKRMHHVVDAPCSGH